MTFKMTCQDAVTLFTTQIDSLPTGESVKFKILPGQPKGDTVLFTRGNNNFAVIGISLGCSEKGIFESERTLIYYYGFIKNSPDERIFPVSVGMVASGKKFKDGGEFLNFIYEKLRIGLIILDEEFEKVACPKCGSTQRKGTCLSEKCNNSALYNPSVKDLPKAISIPKSNTTVPVTAPQKEFIASMRDFLVLNEDMTYNLSDSQINRLMIDEAVLLIQEMTIYRAKFIEKYGKANIKYPQSKNPSTDRQRKYIKGMQTFLKKHGNKTYDFSNNEIDGMSFDEANSLIKQMIPIHEKAKTQEAAKKPSFIDAVTTMPTQEFVDNQEKAKKEPAKIPAKTPSKAKVSAPRGNVTGLPKIILDTKSVLDDDDDDNGF